MTVIGMLGSCKHPEKLIQVYSYAAVATIEGAEFFYFTEDRVKAAEKVIEGYIYEDGHWIVQNCPFPDSVILAEPHLPIDDKVMNELQKYAIILGKGIDDYFSLYQKIKAAEQFAHFLLPCFEIGTTHSLIDLLTRYEKIQIVRPRAENKPHLTIERKAHLYTINSEGCSETMTISSLKAQLKDQLNQYPVYVQPLSNDEQNSRYIVRTQKSATGQWMIRSNSAVSTGYTANKKFPETEDYDIIRYFEHFSLRCSEHIESLEKRHLDQLEFVLIIDSAGRLWIQQIDFQLEYILPFEEVFTSIQQRLKYIMHLEASAHA